MRCTLSVAVLLLSFPLIGQSNLSFVSTYTKRDGLSSNRIFCIREDSRGFLWVGTNEGLNRFDGWQFKNYYTERNNPQSLSHNFVLDILEYQPGMLLIATHQGLSVLNTLSDQFENEKITFAPLKGTSGTKVSSLYKDREGNIWINHSGELDVFDNHLNFLYRFTDLVWAKGIKGTSIYLENWYMDKMGRLWLPSDTSGIQILDFKEKQIINPRNNPEGLEYLQYQYIRSFLVDEVNNTIWVAPWGEGLKIFDLTTGKLKVSMFSANQPGEENTINTLVKTENGYVFFTINGNCYEVDQVNLEYSMVSPPIHNGSSKNDASVQSTVSLKTKNNNFWIGAYGGLYQMKVLDAQREMKIAPTKEKAEITDLSISRDGYVSSTFTNGWLVEIDTQRINLHTYAVPISDNTIVTETVQDHQGRVWIGTSKGIYVFNRANKSFQRPVNLPTDLEIASISVLFCDQNGDIWIVTRGPMHLYCHHTASEKTSQISDEILLPYTSVGSTNRITSITQDTAGRLWMTSELGGGILNYNTLTKQWSHFPKENQLDNLLYNTGISSAYSDGHELIWLSRITGDGLIAYNYGNETIIQYTRENGLLSDYITTIHADHHGYLWLTSENGVSQFDPIQRQIIFQNTWNENINTYLDNQVLWDPYTETLVVGYSDKIIFIPGTNTFDSTELHVPIVDKIYINNTLQYVDPEQPHLNLNYTQKNISIDFTAPYYLNEGKLKFAYRLSGTDQTWTYTNNIRHAQFSFLSPGHYVFQLKVADETGEWSKSYNVLSFSIIPPYWKTPWFVLGVGLVILFTGYRLIRKRDQHIRYDAEIKQKIAETEMMALRAQMNPHFIFNCINSIDSLIQSNDKYLATIYLNKFAKLIRNILDSSKLNCTTLVKDLETLKLYIELELFRNENKFTANIQADPSLLQGDYKVPPLVIQPYVENAILHGLRNRPDNEGTLTIHLNKQNSYIHYIIEDNGVGRNSTRKESPNEKKSYGMEMSSERIRLFNDEEHASVKITDLEENGIPSGTRVDVLLKMI